MKQCMPDGRMGLFIAAMVFLFMLIAVVQADARQPSLKTQLANHGISMKLERLDRTDGFRFGFNFKGPQKQSFVLAPGLDRMLLVIANGHETILQADGTGNMQVIQATGDDTFFWCLVKAWSTFKINSATCTPGESTCTTLSLWLNLLMDWLDCASGNTP